MEPLKSSPILKYLLLFFFVIILSSIIVAAFLFGQLTAKKDFQAIQSTQQQTAKQPSDAILMNPVLNVSQNQKYMELLNLDNQIISLLGLPFLQTNPAATYLTPYTQGLNPQESSTQSLKDLFTRRASLIKDLGLIEENK